MATARKSTKSTASTKAAVLDETVEETVAEVTNKSVINDGINRFIEATGLDGQKARYKAQRAIAFQAFVDSIEADEFDDLVNRAIKNAGDLPAGWGLERTVAEVAAAKPAAKKAPAKSTAKAPAKAAAAKTTTARRRPTR